MTTRRQALAAAPLVALGAVLPTPATARTSSDDRSVLALLVIFAGEVVLAYRDALANAHWPAREHEQLMQLSAQAGQMDGALRHALTQAGGTPSPEWALPYAKVSGGRDAHLRSIVAQEESLTNAWYRAIQRFDERKLIEGSVAFMAAGGRRLVVLRELAGLPLVPRSFESGGL